MVFGVWLGPLAEAARPIQCSTPNTLFTDASPKAISGRTSYYRVRLEFHRYPQVISEFCTAREFGPPRVVTPASPCSWIGHPVSGRVRATCVINYTTRVNACFHCGFIPEDLTKRRAAHSLAHSSIGTPSPSLAAKL